MQIISTSMSTKKDSVVAPVVGSSLIIEPGFAATIVPDVAPSIEVEPRADLHMCEVSQSPPHPPSGSPPALPSSPSHSESQRESSKAFSHSAPT